MLDVVEAVDGARPAFVCTEIRQRRPLATRLGACTAPCAISRAISGADLAETVNRDYGTDVMAVIGRWLPRED